MTVRMSVSPIVCDFDQILTDKRAASTVDTYQDLGLIGFIPHLTKIPHAYGGHAGIDLVFRSGNYDPPAVGSSDGFIRYLATRQEYRGAVAMWDLRLYLDDAGVPVRVSFKGLDDIFACGYTLLRQKPKYRPSSFPPPEPGSQQWKKGPIFPSKGRTIPGLERVTSRVNADNSVEIIFFQPFRLSPLVDLGGYLFTHKFAAYAWCQIRQRIWPNGNQQAFILGSCLPSLQSLIDWNLGGRRCMLAASPAEITAFLAAPAAQLAPALWPELRVL